MTKEPPKQYHRLLGLITTDFVDDSPYGAEIEKDLSIQAQFLDLVIKRTRDGEMTRRWPDGLEGHIRNHNLITFKAIKDTLTGRVCRELLAHTHKYSLLLGSDDNPLPDCEMQLFALVVHFPRDLLRDAGIADDGGYVFDLVCGTPSIGEIRIVVINRLPHEPHNAMLLLFSSNPAAVAYGRQHCNLRSQNTSTHLTELFVDYWKGMGMHYTFAEAARDFARAHLEDLTAEERVKGLPAEERLKGLPAEERLKGLPAEERLKGLPAEERLKDLPVQEQLKALSKEALEELRRQVLATLPSQQGNPAS